MEAPIGQVKTGLFTVSLKWNGTGDVDLHVREAQGTQATVQVSSAADGVLGTKTVTTGAEIGRNPSIDVFNILVGINKGQYSITLNQ